MKIKFRGIPTLVIILFFFQAVWEMISVERRSVWCAQCHEGDPLYFLLYNTGDINNSASLSFIFLFLLDQFFFKYDLAKRILVVISVSIIFYFVERNDLADLPVAILGTLIFLSPKIIYPLQKDRRVLIIE